MVKHIKPAALLLCISFLSLHFVPAHAQWSINAGVGLHSSFSTSSNDAPVVGDDVFTKAVYAGTSYHFDFFGTDGHFGITPGLYLWAGKEDEIYSVVHNGQMYDYTPVSGGVQLPLLFTGSIFPSNDMMLTLSLGPVFGYNGRRYRGEKFDDDPQVKSLTTPEWNFSLSAMMGLGMEYKRFRVQLCTGIESVKIFKESSESLFNLTLGIGYTL